LAELAERAGVSARTVRFYIEQSLLLPPTGGGSGSRYAEENLTRLRHIRRLSAQNLPLAEIRRRLKVMPYAELREVSSPLSAMDYIRQLKGGDVVVSASSGVAPKETAERSHWERYALGPDIEVHARRPLDRETDRALRRLLEHAAQLFAKREGE